MGIERTLIGVRAEEEEDGGEEGKTEEGKRSLEGPARPGQPVHLHAKLRGEGSLHRRCCSPMERPEM